MKNTVLISILFLFVNGMCWAQKIEFKKVSAKTFQSLIFENNRHLLIDVGCKIDFDEARIEGAIFAEKSETLFSILDTTPDNRPVLIYCKYGKRSQKACWLIKEKYPHQVYTLKGGFTPWKEKGFSVESPSRN